MVGLLLCMSMATGMLAGCGSKTADVKKNKVEKVENDVTSPIVNQADIVNAYKEFYHTFYDEHMTNQDLGNGYNLSMMDCPGKLLMNESGDLFLAITDMVFVDEKNVLIDLYIYEYKGNEVVQKVKIPNIKSYDDGMLFSTVGDNIVVDTFYIDKESDIQQVVFTIDENGDYKMFQTDEEQVYTGVGEYGEDGGYCSSYTDYIFSDWLLYKGAFIGQDFEDWLTYYADNTVNSALRFDIMFAEYIDYNRFSDDRIFVAHIEYWKDGLYYIYVPAGDVFNKENHLFGELPVSTEDRLYVYHIDYSYLNENVLENIPKEIDGIKVIVDDDAKKRILEMVEEKNREPKRKESVYSTEF